MGAPINLCTDLFFLQISKLSLMLFDTDKSSEHQSGMMYYSSALKSKVQILCEFCHWLQREKVQVPNAEVWFGVLWPPQRLAA